MLTKSKKKQYKQKNLGYSMVDVLLASPIHPLPQTIQNAYFLRIYSALDDLARSEKPESSSWNLLNDVFNLTKTLIISGYCNDEGQILDLAEKSLANSGRRFLAGQKINVLQEELEPLRAMVEDFQYVVATIPHKVLIQLHRKTTERILAEKQKSQNAREVDYMLIKSRS